MQSNDGTYLTPQRGPFFCGYSGGKALCQDGVVRTLHPSGDGIPDTYFSVPMYVYVKGVRVYGYASQDGDSVGFRAYLYRKHHDKIQKVEAT